MTRGKEKHEEIGEEGDTRQRDTWEKKDDTKNKRVRVLGTATHWISAGEIRAEEIPSNEFCEVVVRCLFLFRHFN